jgi:hypothetical protein
MEQNSDYLTREELRKFLNLRSPKVVDLMVARKQIPVVKLGHRTRRFYLPAVVKALEQLTVQ